MGLFGGKKDETPSIPDAPQISDAPDIPPAPMAESKEPQELPTFPSNSQNEGLNQEMVKSAVNDVPSPPTDTLTQEPSPLAPALPVDPAANASVVEAPAPIATVPQTSPVVAPVEENPVIPAVPTDDQQTVAAAPPLSVNDMSKEVEPIFVRIDKFQDAKDDLAKVSEKAKEMKDTLRKINDVRRKEEEELKMWEDEVEKLKSLLQEIDQEVFNQV